MAIVRIDALRTRNFSTITNSYLTIGTPVQKNWRLSHIVNNTNGDLYISVDGTTDNIFVPASSFVIYDFSANSPPVQVSDNFVLAVGTQFYVRYSTAPTSGDIWITGIYAQGT